MTVKKVEWIGALFGMIGSALFALNLQLEVAGFCAYILSNMSWMYVGKKINSHAMVSMQVVFTCIAVYGIAMRVA